MSHNVKPGVRNCEEGNMKEDEAEVCWHCEGRGKLRNNIFVNGKYTFGFIECDECAGTGVKPRNLAKPNAQPALSDVLAKIRHRAVSVNCGTIEIDDGALEDVLSEYFA